MKTPTPRGIPRPNAHKTPRPGSPADRIDAKPAKGHTPSQPDYDTKGTRQPLTPGPKRLSGKR